ncbi:integrase core domain-containing protein [Quadrisphaera sp. GCM10027208]|uniref:integrase core domain-containing protein n=1 Tax=Quadrisphaera sp. GCM10027208 TaxID=3273423 RepID=UPI003623E06C
MCRYDGHRVGESTVLRPLRDEGLLLEANYQRERRQHAARRKAAFATEPTGPNQVWQLDFSEFETTTGGTWRLAGCRGTTGPSTSTPGTRPRYEHSWHTCPTANQHDAIAAVELALADYEATFGRPLIEACDVDADGNVMSTVALVIDNGGPFRSFRFEAFIATHPEIRHVRTAVKSPGQNGSRERGFGCLKYERLHLEETNDTLDLVAHADDYGVEYNTVRPHEAIAWNRPLDVHLGLADPSPPTLPNTNPCHLLDAGHPEPSP